MERDIDKESQALAVETLKDNGVTVTEVDKEAFKAATLPIYKDACSDVSQEVVDLLKETLGIDF